MYADGMHNFPELSDVQVKKSVFSGFGLKDKWKNIPHINKHYIWQTAGALTMALDGLLAGDMGTVKTGLANATKNFAFFPVKQALERDYDEPESTLRSDFWSSAVSVVTNLPMFMSNYQTFGDIVDVPTLMEAVSSGDLARATISLLGVTAYSVQTALNGKNLLDYRQSLKPDSGDTLVSSEEQGITEFPDTSVTVEQSKMGGFINRVFDSGKELVGKSAEVMAEFTGKVAKKIPSEALKYRSCTSIVMGAFTGNIAQIISGVGFLKGAEERGLANQENVFDQDHSSEMSSLHEEETEEESFGNPHGQLGLQSPS